MICARSTPKTLRLRSRFESLRVAGSYLLIWLSPWSASDWRSTCLQAPATARGRWSRSSPKSAVSAFTSHAVPRWSHTSCYYWHFRDRPDLLQNLLDYWAHEFTAVVTHNTGLSEADPEKRLYETMLMILEHDLAKYELAIRAWAAHDSTAAKAVRQVTRARLDFTHSIFSELGFRCRQLEMRVRLFVSYHTWEHATFPDLSKEERRALLRLRHKLLVSR